VSFSPRIDGFRKIAPGGRVACRHLAWYCLAQRAAAVGGSAAGPIIPYQSAGLKFGSPFDSNVATRGELSAVSVLAIACQVGWSPGSCLSRMLMKRHGMTPATGRQTAGSNLLSPAR
jgi:hypothetical protein